MKYITPTWPAPENIKAYTTLKHSWHNRIEDNEGAVLQDLLSLPDKPIWLDQKHTAIALEADPENNMQTGDAVFTNQAKKVCAVLTADCLPVLVCDQAGTQVAAIHAGWRGLAAGVIENTITKLHIPADETLVWLGPAIGPDKFEVGQDVFDAFTNQHKESAAGFTPYKEGKWLGNLYLLAKIRLQLLGITQVFGGEYCTHTQEDLFYSFRREKENKGRIATVIWRDS